MATFPSFNDLLNKKVKVQPSVQDLSADGASSLGYQLPKDWKLRQSNGQTSLLSPRGFEYKNLKTANDGSINGFDAFDKSGKPVDINSLGANASLSKGGVWDVSKPQSLANPGGRTENPVSNIMATF